MELIKRFFGNGMAKGHPEGLPAARTTGYGRDELGEALPEPDQPTSAEKRRLDLVRRLLREAMSAHGVPSDWLDCRILSSLASDGRSGLHVQFRVRKADQQILGHIHAFQDSFRKDLQRADPRSSKWLLSVAWEFLGQPGTDPRPPMQQVQVKGQTPPDFSETMPIDSVAEDLATDLAQLQALIGRSPREGGAPGH